MTNKKVNNDYWMGLIGKISEASTCRVAIGTLLIQKNVIVGVGYLGSLSGDYHCADKGCLYVDNNGLFGSGEKVSCIRTIHSELNAVLKCSARGVSNKWLECYCTYQPCLNCLKTLLVIGVRTIIYIKPYIDVLRDKYLENLHPDIKSTLYIAQYEEAE